MTKKTDEATAEDDAPVFTLDNVQVFGVAELSLRWGVTRQRADEIASARLKVWRRPACGRLWIEPDIVEFEKGWRRKTGVHIGQTTPPTDKP